MGAGMNEAKAYDKVANFYDALTSSVEWFVSKNRKEILRLTKGHVRGWSWNREQFQGLPCLQTDSGRGCEQGNAAASEFQT